MTRHSFYWGLGAGVHYIHVITQSEVHHVSERARAALYTQSGPIRDPVADMIWPGTWPHAYAHPAGASLYMYM